jgi:hypothetical protein
MRVMASLGLCITPAPELYVANEKTVALTQPIGRDGIPCMYVYDVTLTLASFTAVTNGIFV